jgi:hypothetical protein
MPRIQINGLCGTKKMTANYDLVKEEDKSFKNDYIYFDQNTWNRAPNQKIVIVYLGIRPADEPGFIHKFLAYEYSETRAKLIHQHRFDPELMQREVNYIFQNAGICS